MAIADGEAWELFIWGLRGLGWGWLIGEKRNNIKTQNDFFLKWPYKAATEVYVSRMKSFDVPVKF